MKLFALCALTMLAFAANSLLNRAALADGAIGPGNFAALRTASGMIVLFVLWAIKTGDLPRPTRPQWVSVLGLAAYMIGFSQAYVSLDAGLGALILFAGVQITMFGGGVLWGERPVLARWAGTLVALTGLIVLFWPTGAGAPAMLPVFGMICAALGWGIYSLKGRSSTDPLAATAQNFAWALPLTVLALFIWPDAGPVTARGAGLAVVSGGITSGMGYALWYTLLPRLQATSAALAQLSVPVIALFAGALLLEESITQRAIMASLLVVGGIATGVLWPYITSRSKGS